MRTKSTLASATFAAALALTLTACAGNSAASSTAPSAEGTPVTGGTLTFAQQFEPSCLDPTVLGDMHQASFALQYLDSLVAQDDTGKVLPWLATSWEISKDGKVYTFHLREDVKFTDGVPLDAAAVKANFDRIKDPKSKAAGGSTSQYLIYVDHTDVVDEFTVAVTLSRPFSPFLEEAAQSFVGIQSPKALERSSDENCKSPVGTGPFIVKSYKPGQEAVLVRNPDYNSAPPTAKHQGPAYLDEIVWKFIPDPTARFGAVTSSEIDAADGLTPVNEVAAGRDDHLAINRHDYPGHAYGVTLNESAAPFDDVRVRKAFLYSVDVEAGLKSIFFGLYERPSVLSRTTPFFAEEFVDAYTYDADEAGALLDQAGWTARDSAGYRTKDGKRLSLTWTYYTEAVGGPTEYKAFAEQVQASAKQIGFEITLDPVSSGFAEIIERYNEDTSQLFIQKWTLNSPDVLRLVYAAPPEAPLFKNIAVSDTKFSDAINDAALTTDPAERAKLYHDAQQIFSDQAYGIGFFPESVRIVSQKSTAHGIRQDPSLGLPVFQDAWVTE
jgi:peptide/nickel transport system substrate-binding protein